MNRLFTAMTVALLVLMPLEIEFSWAVTPRPPMMPWTTFSGEMASVAERARVIACPNGQEVFLARFPYRDTVYVMAAAMDESGNILFVYDGDPKNKTSPPTEIGFGHVDMKTPGASDLVPPLQWEPFDEAKHDNPCILLFPATT